MASVEWNKKEELVADQALKHLKVTFTVHLSGNALGMLRAIMIVCLSVRLLFLRNFLLKFYLNSEF